MRKQAFKQVYKDNGLEVALEALEKSIARWTDKDDRLTTAIPGLSLFRWTNRMSRIVVCTNRASAWWPRGQSA